MYTRDMEHPDVTAILLYGYPSWATPKSIYCCECGKCLDYETVYEDALNAYLCEDCLKMLHEVG